MQKCLNSSPWASCMIARASASSVSDAQRRAKVRIASDSSPAGSWYWSNPTLTSFARVRRR